MSNLSFEVTEDLVDLFKARNNIRAGDDSRYLGGEYFENKIFKNRGLFQFNYPLQAFIKSAKISLLASSLSKSLSGCH